MTLAEAAARPTAMLAPLIAALAITGCSASTGTKSMARADVEKQSTVELARTVGVKPSEVPPIHCPGDLEAKVGNTMTCSLGGPPGKVFDVLITVTKVNDNTNRVFFDVKVAKQPRP